MSIFINELRHFSRQWYVYLFGAILFFAAMLSMWGMAAEATTTTQVYNSAYSLCYMGNYFSVMLLFLLPATVGAALHRDYRSRMYRLLYAYPIAKGPYLRAKFGAAILVVFLLGSMIAVGFAVGAILPGTVPGVIEPFRWVSYLQLLGGYLWPNLLLVGALVFAVVVRTRNIYSSSNLPID